MGYLTFICFYFSFTRFIYFINANDFPVLDEIGNQTVAELENLQFTATSSDPSGHDRTFSLSANAPVGAMIDEVTGLFSWTPTAAQGPASYTFDVIVIDRGFHISYEFEYFYQCIISSWCLRDSRGPV